MDFRILCLTLVLALLLTGCYGECAEPGPTTAANVPTTVPAETTLPETTVPETILPPTTCPAETEPEFSLHSGIRSDGTFGEGTLFIGDSLTVGLVKHYLTDNQLLGDARYLAACGAALTAFHLGPRMGDGTTPCVYSPEYEGLRMQEAILVEPQRTTAVYIMLGTNYSKYASDETYIEIVDALLQSCPNATVYLQLVPNDDSERVNSARANQMTQRVYDYYLSAGNERVQCVDTCAAIGWCLAADGIHLTTEGQENWYNCLLAFAAENGIPE